MNKSFIILISLLFSFSEMHSQTKGFNQTELYQKCINSKKYIKEYSSANLKDIAERNIDEKKTWSPNGYSSIQNMKESVLIMALEQMTLETESEYKMTSTIKEKSEGENSKSSTETIMNNGGYIYSKHIHVNFAHLRNIKVENNTYEQSFQTMTQLIFKEDTIRHSSETISSNNDQSYAQELTIGKNKNWYNDVINELKYNGMEFNFIEDKKKMELCISLKKDLIKKE